MDQFEKAKQLRTNEITSMTAEAKVQRRENVLQKFGNLTAITVLKGTFLISPISANR